MPGFALKHSAIYLYALVEQDIDRDTLTLRAYLSRGKINVRRKSTNVLFS